MFEEDEEFATRFSVVGRVLFCFHARALTVGSLVLRVLLIFFLGGGSYLRTNYELLLLLLLLKVQ